MADAANPRTRHDVRVGATADKTLRHPDRVEIVMVRGRDGGAGTIDVDDLRYRVLPPPTHPLPRPMTAVA